jgi:hypothetical protein
MINDFKKEKSSWIFICKKCCRRTMTKLNPFRKSKFEIKIRNSGKGPNQETEAKKRWRRVGIMIMATRQIRLDKQAY